MYGCLNTLAEHGKCWPSKVKYVSPIEVTKQGTKTIGENTTVLVYQLLTNTKMVTLSQKLKSSTMWVFCILILSSINEPVNY